MIKRVTLNSALGLAEYGTRPYSGPGVRRFHTVLKDNKTGCVIETTVAHKGMKISTILTFSETYFLTFDLVDPGRLTGDRSAWIPYKLGIC